MSKYQNHNKENTKT